MYAQPAHCIRMNEHKHFLGYTWMWNFMDVLGIWGMYISTWMRIRIKKINHKVPFYCPESCKSILPNRVIDHNFILRKKKSKGL